MCAVADVLRVKPAARLKILKNGVVQYNQAYVPTEDAYTEHTGDRVVLATNMSTFQQIDLGGLTSAERLLITVSNTVTVAINATAIAIPISECIMLDGAAVTALYVKNTSTTVEPAVEYVLTD